MALINCPECNKEISDKAISCPNCGNPMNDRPHYTEDKEFLVCPKCKSKDLHTGQTGFSGGKALAGAVLAGGIGILAGTIGSNEVIITCLKCGNRFKTGEARIEITGKRADDLEERIAALLIQDNEQSAIDLYQSITNTGYGLTIANLARIAGERKINYRPSILKK